LEKQFRKKPIVITATQWFAPGDHPAVQAYENHPMDGPCSYCRFDWDEHGWIETLEGGHVVCPGDWIITGIKGEQYPCKPDIFEATYEPVISYKPLPTKIPSHGKPRLP